MNNVDLVLTNSLGKSIVVDVSDFPYRLNRNVFTTSSDKLKVLGGTFSTQMELSKSKVNNQFFSTKSEIKSINKFYNLNHYDAVLYENGVEVIRGKFKLEEITNSSYKGTFFDNDIDWVDRLSNIRLNELGYVNGSPTWLVPFDGASSFNTVNALNNRETDFICPTLIYNNTPITDYLDFSDGDIWGTFEANPSPPPALTRLTDGLSFPDDFITKTGFFGDRLGLTFEDFPPALYYRNVLERCIHEIGFEIECPLFYEEWFNRLYMTYSGDGYEYNWKNLATVNVPNEYVLYPNQNEMDDLVYKDALDDDINVNRNQLPPLGGGAGNKNWINDEKFYFGKANIIKHDDYTNPATVDKIVAYNKFDVEGQYICPVDGSYTISVNSMIQNYLVDEIDIYDGPTPIWLGESLINSFGSWDVNSTTGPFLDRHYGWDDNVLVIRRYNENNDEVFVNTDTTLYQWMNGENQLFISEPSDVIAYFSPKRWYINEFVTPLADNQYKGSPLSDFQLEVTVDSASHNIVSNSSPKHSVSTAEISVTIDLKKNERIEIYWTHLKNINGQVSLWYGTPPFPYSNAYFQTTNYTELNNSIDNQFQITYNCGEYDLNLAKNLPAISGKDFISNFINQFNLYVTVNGNCITFLTISNYYSPEVYDITSRVVDNDWISTPVTDNGTKFIVGYNNDNNDRLLSTKLDTCKDSIISSINYANIDISNDNIYSNNEIRSLNGFSSTKFYNGKIQSVQYNFASIFFPTSTDPYTGQVLTKGYTFSLAAPLEYYMDIPSIQSESSFLQNNVGSLDYNYQYSPRLLYHLGTVEDYLGYSDIYQCIVDSPRAETAFIRKTKHWYLPTVSAFDTENNNPYRTLRYDTENGLYNTYFENLVDLYNKSEVLTLKMAMRNIDWINMKGSKRIKYQDSLYRLMSINGYDPLTSALCTIKLLKEI